MLCMDLLQAAYRTLGTHVGPALWAVGIFAAGFALAFPVVRYNVRSLLAFPEWLFRLAQKYLRPDVNPVLLCLFIFGFNSIAIFIYMMSGGLVVLPIVFDLLTGLNVGAIMLMEASGPEEPPEAPPDRRAPARAWVGFLTLFVLLVELSAFWLSIGMGIGLGHAMEGSFSWTMFEQAARPIVLAYVVVIVPALAASAVAETITLKATM